MSESGIPDVVVQEAEGGGGGLTDRERENLDRFSHLAKVGERGAGLGSEAPEGSEVVQVSSDREKALRAAQEVIRSDVKGNCVEVRDPVAAAGALAMMGDGASEGEVEKAGLMGRGAAAGLASRHEGFLARHREAAMVGVAETTSALGEAARLKAVELVEDEEVRGKANIKDIMLAFGIAVDKAGKLAGEADTVVEHRKGLSLADAMRLRDEAEARVAKGRVVEEGD